MNDLCTPVTWPRHARAGSCRGPRPSKVGYSGARLKPVQTVSGPRRHWWPQGSGSPSASNGAASTNPRAGGVLRAGLAVMASRMKQPLRSSSVSSHRGDASRRISMHLARSRAGGCRTFTGWSACPQKANSSWASSALRCAPLRFCCRTREAGRAGGGFSAAVCGGRCAFPLHHRAARGVRA